MDNDKKKQLIKSSKVVKLNNFSQLIFLRFEKVSNFDTFTNNLKFDWKYFLI